MLEIVKRYSKRISKSLHPKGNGFSSEDANSITLMFFLDKISFLF